MEDLLVLKQELQEIKQAAATDHNQTEQPVLKHYYSSTIPGHSNHMMTTTATSQNNVIEELRTKVYALENDNAFLHKQLDDNDKLISLQRKEIADQKTKIQSLELKSALQEKRIKNEQHRCQQLEEQLSSKPQQQLQNETFLQQQQKPIIKGYQPLIRRMQSVDKINQPQRFTGRLDSIRNKREEVSTFLDESSFIHSYALPNQNLSLVQINNNKNKTLTHEHNEQLIHETMVIEKQLEDKENQQENFENQIMRLFPDRAIKASGFIDFFKSNSKGGSMIRIKNPVKKLARDIDLGVEELSAQLHEQNIQLKMCKIKDFIYEIQVPVQQQDKDCITKIIKLGLSGSSLLVKVGGGYFDFLEYLDRKGILNQNQQYQTL